MTARPVRMSDIMDLEPKGVLQEVPRLLPGQPADHGRAFSDVHNLQLSRLGQAARRLLDLPGSRYLVRAQAACELRRRRDVAHSLMPT